LNRWTRISFGIALSLKFLGSITVLVLGHVLPHDSNYFLLGVICCEFPSYVIASCYSCVLMFWLSICSHVLPARYEPVFKVMRVVLIVFNVLAYLALIATIIVLAVRRFADSPIHNSFNGVAALCRDFVLGTIFLVFIITLKIGLTSNRRVGETIDERRLIRFTLILLVILLCRGGVSLTQGLVFANEKTECGIPFLAMVAVYELLCEGAPFVFLIHINNDFLVTNEDQEASRKNPRDSDLMVGALV
jgi:hypothetical protein